MTKLPEYVIERDFDAPREMVWRAWTEPEFLSRWYGPGVETIIHKFDLEPGGLWLNEMKWGENSDLSRIEFKEVVAPERLVWHQSSTDADWNVIANPMMPDWPRTVATTVTFQEVGQQTKVRLSWLPFEASDAEIACFAGAMENFGKGWGAGFDMIAEILAEMKAQNA